MKKICARHKGIVYKTPRKFEINSEEPEREYQVVIQERGEFWPNELVFDIHEAMALRDWLNKNIR